MKKAPKCFAFSFFWKVKGPTLSYFWLKILLYPTFLTSPTTWHPGLHNYQGIQLSFYVCEVPKGVANGSATTESQPGTSTEQTDDSCTPVVPDDIYSYYEKIDQDDEEETELKTVSFEINQDYLETLQKRYEMLLNICKTLVISMTVVV